MPRSKPKKQKQQKYNKFHLALSAIFIIVVVLAIANARPEDTSIATERTVSQHSDLFFTYIVVKYPAKAEILTPTQYDQNLTIGINTGSNELDFGRVETGGSVRKHLNLTTNDDKASKVTLKSRGTISHLIVFNQSAFLLKGDMDVPIVMNAGSYPGNFSGDISIIIQRSSHDVLKQILGY